MEFLNFCQSLGIIVNSPPPVGVWKRYPTVDHPRKRNGAVKFMGDHGFAQNHALDTEVSVWKDESVTEGAKRDFQKIADHAEQERRVREAVDQDRLGKRLKPRARAREHVPNQVREHVSVAQHAQGLADRRAEPRLGGARPRRPASKLAANPASTTRVVKPGGCRKTALV